MNGSEEIVQESLKPTPPVAPRRPSLVVNAMSNWAFLFVEAIVGFVLTPYIIFCLGTSDFGIWTLIRSVIGYYGLLDLGITSAILRYAARYAGQNNHEELNKVFNTSLAFFTLVGIVVMLATVFIADPLADFFHIEGQKYNIFKQIIWLLGASAAIAFPANVLSVILLAYERFVLVNVVRITSTILRGILCFSVLHNGGGLVGIGWVNLGLSLMGLLIFLVILMVYIQDVRITPSLVNKRTALSLFTFGFFALICRVGDLLRFKFDAVVIGKFLNLEMVGVYAPATILFGFVFRAVVSCSGVTHPRLSALAGQSTLTVFREAFLRYSNLLAVFTAGLGIVSIVASKDLMHLWLPENFADVNSASLAFCILILGLLPDLMTSVSVNALQAVKKHPFLGYYAIVEGAANLGLSIFLVGRLGIVGVALGTAIPAAIGKLIIQPIYCCHVLGVNWQQYMLRVLIKPLLLLGFLFFVFRTISPFLDAPSYHQLVLETFAVLSTYSLIGYFLCLNEDNRRSFKAKAISAFNGLRLILKRQGHNA